jgi:hypothetical protein
MLNGFVVLIDGWVAGEYATREEAYAKREQMLARYSKSFVTILDARWPNPDQMARDQNVQTGQIDHLPQQPLQASPEHADA